MRYPTTREAAAPSPQPQLPPRSQPSVAAQRRHIIFRCVIIAALLLSITSASMTGAGIAIVLLPLPIAWLALRVSGWVATITVVLLTVAAAAVAYQSRGVDAAVMAAWLSVVICGGVSWTLTNVALGRRFQRYALSACATAWVLALVSLTALGIWQHGFNDVRQSVRDVVNSTYQPSIDSCATPTYRKLAANSCDELVTQRDAVIGVIDDHGRVLLWPAVALLALICAALTLSTFRLLASRAGLPVQRAIKLREVEAPWPTAYLLAAGLMAIMIASQLDASYDWLRVVGFTVTTIGVAIVLVQSIAVTAWLMSRGSVSLPFRILLWISIFIFWYLALPFLIVLGLWEMTTHFRRTPPKPDNMSRPGPYG